MPSQPAASKQFCISVIGEAPVLRLQNAICLLLDDLGIGFEYIEVGQKQNMVERHRDVSVFLCFSSRMYNVLRQLYFSNNSMIHGGSRVLVVWKSGVALDEWESFEGADGLISYCTDENGGLARLVSDLKYLATKHSCQANEQSSAADMLLLPVADLLRAAEYVGL